ncbi:response regulator [Dyadobacter subterraneus]|uniref:Response regulator transcription factor n=1 Tax=Dyadobacter subterraneus TaxID=2773304 RepID=A0ABR9WAR1_9BACT|nr:response regulator transcription factor [Dyadobacter subterraneus]MBE9461466.1 response regulator transcription factor [Dyadobacter subterraneus]
MKNVLIAEDHPLLIIGIESMLMESIPDATIFKAADFKKALNLLEKHTIDLLVMDINLPHGDKVGMVEAVRLKQPNILILVCSSYEEHLYALPFLKAGANGYISKTASSEEFKTAVEYVLNSKIYASPAVLNNMFGILFNTKGSDSKALDKLSVKEVEIAKLLTKGLSTKEIGEHINLSASSISTYKSKIFEKLGVNNIIELTTYLELNS